MFHLRPLHSPALCDSVRPGWVIKKARAQVVIIRGLSSMGSKKKTPTRKVTSAPPLFFLFPAFLLPPRAQCCFEHCSTPTTALKCSVNMNHKHLRTLPTNINSTVNTHIHPQIFFPPCPRCASRRSFSICC